MFPLLASFSSNYTWPAYLLLPLFSIFLKSEVSFSQCSDIDVRFFVFGFWFFRSSNIRCPVFLGVQFLSLVSGFFRGSISGAHVGGWVWWIEEALNTNVSFAKVQKCAIEKLKDTLLSNFKWFRNSYMKLSSSKSHLVISRKERVIAEIGKKKKKKSPVSKCKKLLAIDIVSTLALNHFYKICKKRSKKWIWRQIFLCQNSLKKDRFVSICRRNLQLLTA